MLFNLQKSYISKNSSYTKNLIETKLHWIYLIFIAQLYSALKSISCLPCNGGTCWVLEFQVQSISIRTSYTYRLSSILITFPSLKCNTQCPNLRRRGLVWLTVQGIQAIVSGLQERNIAAEEYGGSKVLSSWWLGSRSRQPCWRHSVKDQIQYQERSPFLLILSGTLKMINLI